MSLWQQGYSTYSTQFITDTSGGNIYQHFNFENLNNTSLNFARPGKQSDSHTAAMTAEQRKLREQLPPLIINTDVNKKCHSQENNSSLKKFKVNSQDDARNSKNSSSTTTRKSHDQVNNNAKVTQTGARVKFAIDDPNSHDAHDANVAADPDNGSKVVGLITRKQKQLKAYRRASAPAQGIDYYFKNVKQQKNHVALNFYEMCPNEKRNHRVNVPAAHAEADEVGYENEDNMNNINIINDHNNNHTNSSSMSSSVSSAMDPSNPPSLSPCSSTSSLSSSIDLLSPALNKQSYNFPNPWIMKPKSKIVASETPFRSESLAHSLHAHSLPDDVPWSPAAMYLANFVNTRQALPDEEGQEVGDYIIGKVIGHGGFSTVKQACTVNKFTGSMETVAVKIVKNHTDSEDNDRIQALLEREITIWNRLEHQNIVQMLSFVENDYATFVFSEYCPKGTLLDYIKEHSKGEGKGLDEDEARTIFLEISEAIRYLHNDMRLVHKDIKLDNILLDKEGIWKLCDFGLTEFQNSANGFNNILYNGAVGGSLAYCAPEQLRSPTPLKDPSVDIWSLGVVLFAMVTGQLPFSDSFGPRLQHKIINGRYDESLLDSSGASSELKDLLNGMFTTKPDKRLTISEVLEHPWCRDI